MNHYSITLTEYDGRILIDLRIDGHVIYKALVEKSKVEKKMERVYKIIKNSSETFVRLSS